MNVQETTGIRELSVEELDLVTGGFGMDWFETDLPCFFGPRLT